MHNWWDAQPSLCQCETSSGYHRNKGCQNHSPNMWTAVQAELSYHLTGFGRILSDAPQVWTAVPFPAQYTQNQI